MGAPYEVHAAPLTAFINDPGSLFPSLDTDPVGAGWGQLGVNGDLNYMDDGIKLSHPLASKGFRGLGDPGTLKEFIDTEDVFVEVTIADFTLENYARALNGNTVTPVAAGPGTVGYKKMGLSRGIILGEFALLLRGTRASGYGDDMIAQFEFPRVIQVGEPNPVFRRSDAIALAFKFKVLVDPNATSAEERLGRLLQQNAAAGT